MHGKILVLIFVGISFLPANNDITLEEAKKLSHTPGHTVKILPKDEAEKLLAQEEIESKKAKIVEIKMPPAQEELMNFNSSSPLLQQPQKDENLGNQNIARQNENSIYGNTEIIAPEKEIKPIQSLESVIKDVLKTFKTMSEEDKQKAKTRIYDSALAYKDKIDLDGIKSMSITEKELNELLTIIQELH